MLGALQLIFLLLRKRFEHVLTNHELATHYYYSNKKHESSHYFKLAKQKLNNSCSKLLFTSKRLHESVSRAYKQTQTMLMILHLFLDLPNVSGKADGLITQNFRC